LKRLRARQRSFRKELVEGGNAANQETVELDDVLIGLTAVKVVGAKFERRLLPTFLRF
jgi:hypothetical protein